MVPASAAWGKQDKLILKRVWDDLKTLHAWFNVVKTRWNPAFKPNLISFFGPEKGIG